MFPVGNDRHRVVIVGGYRDGSLLRLSLMADGSDATLDRRRNRPTTASPALVAGHQDVRAVHGGATAVIEYVGRRGARIVLVGEDGEWADDFAAGTDIARAACADGRRRGGERMGA